LVLQEATTHWPLTQPAVPFATLHALPQAPQLLTSVCRLRQVPPQLVCPLGQHFPLEQLPLAQAVPHAPQLFGLL
jgi:hypothetical protein